MSNAAASPSDLWTNEQRQAIETRDVSVSLSAGAGCGKTFVLTRRYLAYFSPHDPQALRPDDLHHLVAITFTERAAREMRDRIRRECYEELKRADAVAAGYWSAIVRGLDSARISTIHSFCSSLLRSHAVEAGLDPQFEVLEQAQTETLLSEVIDDELRRLVADRDAATIELATRYDLHALRDLVRTLVVEAREDELGCWRQIGPEEQVARWQALFEQRVAPAIARHVAQSPAAVQVLQVLGENVPDHPQMRLRRTVLLEKLPGLSGIDQPTTLAVELQIVRDHAKVQGGGTARNWQNPAAYVEFKEAATELRKTIDAIGPLLAFDPAAAIAAATIGQQLLAIAAEARRRYAERKQALAMLDFDDLLARARTLLVDPANDDLRRRMSAQIQLLLVDEFQDTDRVQIELVKALCGEAVSSGKLFFVGDVKQSIYRFRGADPDVFRRLRDETPAPGQLSLTTNFRSQPAILEFANALFWQELGDDYEALRPHRSQSTPRPAVEFLWAHAGDNPSREDVRTMRRREAEWIALRIRAMLDGAAPLVGENDSDDPGQERTRPAKPGDCAILFRALSDVELYEDALRRHDIDYYLVGGHAFYAQQEIFDLLNLLRAVASPSDGVSLAGVLRSAFFALQDETLFWLAQHRDGLTEGLFADDPPPQIPSQQRAQAVRAAETLRVLRDSKDRVRICELIELAMTLTGYDATLLAEFLGERKLANLRKVIEQARGFERDGAFDLADFIAELTEFVARQPKEPLAATLSEDTDVVRLMTIHQAKGLEF
ncbi:MAG: UvrD-helicase domain-containing protein, partial [Pirellulales bacterium]